MLNGSLNRDGERSGQSNVRQVDTLFLIFFIFHFPNNRLRARSKLRPRGGGLASAFNTLLR